MKDIKIIIGANFGDEGKGLATDYFANKDSLVVCHNGGSQKGHTIVSENGLSHITHHVGSGIFHGADTYLSKDYILNSIIFKREWIELGKKGIVPNIYINKDCRITTPYEMITNQIIEEYRGKDKHGSCGLGINETVIRDNYCNINLNNFNNILLKFCNNFMYKRLYEYNIELIPDKWKDILKKCDNIEDNYIEDLLFMYNKIKIVDDSIFDNYNSIIFEGSQGLMLDQNNIEYMPYLTTSNTGLDNPIEIIKNNNLCDNDIEVCYITRSYITRHGAGRFDEECKKSLINKNMVDLTNIPNKFQDNLRYGLLTETIKDRIIKDLNKGKDLNLKKSLFITHLNEYDKSFDILYNLFKNDKFNFYKSYNMTRNNIEIIKGE